MRHLGLSGPIALLALASFAFLAAPPASAQQKEIPDFSSDGVGWQNTGLTRGNFLSVPGQLPPLANDPAYPYVPNATGAQPNYRIADLANPNLKPWVKEVMKKDNDEVLAGKIAFTASSSCMPAGVPGFMAYGGATPLFFLQTPKEVWLIFTMDHQVRRVYMDIPHSENPRPSWYGESVGRYEGDTLVIDTIGQNDKSFVDNFRTPHTEKLHVVERWKKTNDGKALEVTFTVEDLDAFYQPWSGRKTYRRVEAPMAENVCAENNQQFDYHMPVANRADF